MKWSMLRPRLSELVLSGLAGCVVLLMGLVLDWADRRVLASEDGAVLAQRLTKIGVSVEQAFNERIRLLSSLETLARGDREQLARTFPVLAGSLRGVYPEARNIYLAQDGVVSQVFPVLGNEALLGVDLRQVPAQAAAVERALAGETVVAAPVELLQGGRGVIIRLPVYVADARAEGGRRIWGIAGGVFDYAGFFDSLRQTLRADEKPDEEAVAFALYRWDAAGRRHLVYRAGHDLDLGGQTASYDLSVGGERWQVLGQPLPSGAASRSRWLPSMLVLLGVLAAGVSFFLMQANRRRRESEYKLWHLLEHAPLPMLLAEGPAQRVVFSNRRFAEAVGYARAEIPDMDHWWLLACPDSAYRRQLQARWQSCAHQDDALEARIRCKGGEERTCRLHTTSFGAQCLLVLVDLTELRAAERALREAKQTAESASQAKSEFLANMSHEIRTPMNAILGFGEILGGLIQDPLQQEYLAAIHDSGKSLLQLINDILDLSKVEAGKLTLEYHMIDVRRVLRDMRTLFAHKIQDKRLDFQIEVAPDLPPALSLDETRLRQVLLNLVGNAVKFTEHGRISVAARAEKTGGRVRLQFSVADSGVGIPAAERERIFGAFAQAQGQSHAKYGGTGLGLAITKRLVEMMDGNIAVGDTPGGGATFTVTFAAVEAGGAPESEAAREAPLPPQADGTLRFQPATLLIAEDLAFNRKLLKIFLAGEDFTLLEAENGQQAVELARRERPALVLLDMKMPVLDGYAAARRLRELAETRDIPLVAVTAAAMKEEESEILEICDALLTKPVERQQLLAVLARFLPHQAAETPPAGSEAQAPPMPAALVQGVRGALQARWEKLGPHSSINDLESFARSAAELARQYDYRPLQTWAERLHKQVLLFDIEQIPKTLAGFADYLREAERP